MDAQFSQPNLNATRPILHGFYNGVMRTVDKPAEWLGDLAAKSGVSGTIRNLLMAHGVSAAHANQLVPALGQSAVNDAANEQAYTKAYGNNPAAQAGQMLGQTAVVAPVISTVGGVGGMLADATGTALSDAAPIAAKVIQGARNFLSGTAGADTPGIAGGIAKTASTVAHGAQIGAQAAAYTGEPIAKGAEYGAVLGPAGTVIGKALGAGATVGKNALSIFTDMSPTATQNAAANRLVQAFQADGLTMD